MELKSEFWRGKKVLVTGHTGFKGSWLSIWLQQLKSEVIGLSLEPPSTPSLYAEASVHESMTSLRGDIRDLNLLCDVFEKYQPEIVIHMAAQSLVRKSYADPVETYSTNVMGTLNVLEAIRKVKTVKAAVMVTTDKCYENKEWHWGYRESDPMGGFDPYSSSKGCSELLIASYRNSYFQNSGTYVASARAGNVIGGGDWAQDRLIPDIVRNLNQGKTVAIRNPTSIRPWQHVLGPLSGYLLLAESLYNQGAKFAEGWNFGSDDNDALPVKEIVDQIVKTWGRNAAWTLDGSAHPHEAHYLKLDSSKSRALLHWRPIWDIEMGLQKTVQWYQSHSRGEPARQLCLNQISEYSQAIN